MSWKSIASHFDCDERTAKRWEQERGLPVHRAPGGKRSAVFAYTSELDSWLRTGLQGEVAGSIDGKSSSQGPETADGAGPASVVSKARRGWPVRVVASGAILFVATAGLLTYKYRYSELHKLAPVHALPSVVQHVPAADAEDLYLQGRYYWNLRTADSLTKAIDDYTGAIVKDPSYAEAYAGLAESYDLLPQFAQVDPATAFVRAEAAADRAIQLQPDLAAAHRAKAFALFFWDWDIPGSDGEFQQALALDPNSAETHHWYASTLLNRLEGGECLKQIDEALRLSPSSAAIATDNAFMHEEFGPDSGASMKRLLDLEQTQPTLLTPSYFLAAIDFARGDYPAYIEQLHRTASISRQPDDIAIANAATRGWTQDGKAGLWKEIVQVQKKAFQRGTESGYRVGQTYLLLGRPQEALPFFKASFSQHFILLITMEQCAWSRKLPADSEYAALFTQIRQQMHGGGPAHPSTLPDSLDLPQ